MPVSRNAWRHERKCFHPSCSDARGSKRCKTNPFNIPHCIGGSTHKKRNRQRLHTSADTAPVPGPATGGSQARYGENPRDDRNAAAPFTRAGGQKGAGATGGVCRTGSGSGARPEARGFRRTTPERIAVPTGDAPPCWRFFIETRAGDAILWAFGRKSLPAGFSFPAASPSHRPNGRSETLVLHCSSMKRRKRAVTHTVSSNAGSSNFPERLVFQPA